MIDMNERIIVIDVNFLNNMYRLIMIHAPNHPLERETYFQNIVNDLADCNHENIVGVDNNYTLDPLVDRGECNYVDQVVASPPVNQDLIKHIIADKGANVLLHHNDVIMGAMASQIISLAIVYSTVFSGADQRKHQSPVSLAFVRGNSPGTGEFPAQMAS